MGERLIIQNDTNLPMSEAIEYVRIVIGQGKLSNEGKQYCYHTVFEDGVGVTSFLNKKSERLVVR